MQAASSRASNLRACATWATPPSSPPATIEKAPTNSWSSTSAPTHEGRATFLDTIRRVAEQLNIPLTAGGGIRTLEDGRNVLRAGADKVTVNTAASSAPTHLRTLAAVRRASCRPLDRCKADRPGNLGGLYAWRPRRHGLDAAKWAAEAVSRGAGEVLLTSIDRDGTCSGFDCDLTAKIAATIPVPIIASGGASTFDDFLDVFQKGAADAALAASVFHSATHSIPALKTFLADRQVPIRLSK